MANAFWFDEGTITVKEADDTDLAIAGFQGLTVEAGFETLEQLYTADSVFVESQKQAQHRVNVEIEYSKWDADAAKYYLGGGSSATASTDTSDPAKFNILAVSTSADGSIERTVEVENVTFENFPMVDGSQGEFEAYTLSGTGEKVTNLDTAAPA
jgi:hypothetical protein